jgi:hypothetical protein
MNDDPSNAIAVLVRFRKWDELLSFPEPAEKSLGLAAALQAQGRKAEAAAQRARFQTAWRFSDVPAAVEDV